ncbi:MAG: hypothetical protein IKY94_15575 [Lachnospiraceae bacterium]|jgi:hypothetical protein|nr:hypothetical protein [Lachnospiraceae bacterium]
MILAIFNILLASFLLLDIMAFLFMTKEFIQLKLEPLLIIFAASGAIVLILTFIYYIIGRFI